MKSIVLVSGVSANGEELKTLKNSLTGYYPVESFNVSVVQEFFDIARFRMSEGAGSKEIDILLGLIEKSGKSSKKVFGEYVYEYVAREIEEFFETPIDENIILLIYGFSDELSNDIQEEYPVFEIELGRSDKFQKEAVFHLDLDDCEFSKKAKELIEKLQIKN